LRLDPGKDERARDKLEKAILLSVPVYKVLLIGNANTGKSSLIRRLILDEFDESYCATVGVDLSAIAVNVDAFTPVILTVIDLGGQEDFTALRSQYYKGAHFVTLVYDVSDRDSFEALPEWYRGLLVALDGETGKQLPGALVGNKSDREESRQVSSAEGRVHADSLGWPFFEASAKTGENVQDVFTRIAKELYGRHPPR